MRILVLLACICYWVLLTTLLLVPNPAKLVGLPAVPIFPWGKFGIHLIAFTGLGFLVSAMRWPRVPSWQLTAFLVVYGITTEWLQRFSPPRTPRVMDAVENILGIAIGTDLYWLALRLVQRLKPGLATGMTGPAAEKERDR